MTPEVSVYVLWRNGTRRVKATRVRLEPKGEWVYFQERLHRDVAIARAKREIEA